MLDLDERAIVALEMIGLALTRIADTNAARLSIEHPHKVQAVRDAEVTKVHDTEKELRESQGDTGEESDDAWLGKQESPFDDLGPREKEAASAETAAAEPQGGGPSQTRRVTRPGRASR